MFEDIDTKHAGIVKEQIADLTSIVASLIDLDTGNPLPGTTKEQMLCAIEHIRGVQAIYDKRAAHHEALRAKELEFANEVVKTRELNERINKKYGGKVFPKWFMKMLGSST